MTEPRIPNDPGGVNRTGEPAAPDQPAVSPSADASDAGAGNDSPTRPWPSLIPSSETGPSAAAWSASGPATEPERSGSAVPGPGAATGN